MTMKSVSVPFSARPSMLALPAVALIALVAMGADAQVMKGHDSYAPVNFTADRI